MMMFSLLGETGSACCGSASGRPPTLPFVGRVTLFSCEYTNSSNICVSAGRGRDEEPGLPEAPKDPGGAEHRQDGKKGSPETVLNESFFMLSWAVLLLQVQVRPWAVIQNLSYEWKSNFIVLKQEIWFAARIAEFVRLKTATVSKIQTSPDHPKTTLKPPQVRFTQNL